MQGSGGQTDRGTLDIAMHSPRSFSDDRGITLLLNEDKKIDFIEYVEFNSAGDIRGGHFHREYTEQFHVLSGTLSAEFIDMSSGSPGPVASMILHSGTTVTIPPATAHRFTARKPAQAIAFGNGASPLLDRAVIDSEMWDNDDA
jgi:dTDP-4-dehydrorhamnose 3,5-epimerase-like enzyme